MNLYIIRHGDAEDGQGKSDFDRRLTEKGVEKMKAAVEGWDNCVKKINVIVSSPLIRAKQTAEIVAKAYNTTKEIIVDNRLQTGSTPEAITEAITEVKGDNIAVVGHMPDLAYLVSYLISNSGATIDLSKGAVAKISFSGKVKEGCGMLEFLIPVKAFTKND